MELEAKQGLLGWWHRWKLWGPRGVEEPGGSQPRAAPDRQQGPVQFVVLEHCLLCLGEKCLCLPLCLWVSHDPGLLL